MTTPETLDYLAVAKANWNAVPGLDGTPEHGMSAAQTCALVSIAESLAVLAGDLREERLRSESLRGALAQARAEADESAALVDRVWKIINGDGTDIARIAAIHEAVTR